MKIETLERALEYFSEVTIQRDQKTGAHNVILRMTTGFANGSVRGEGQNITEAIESAISRWPNNFPIKMAEFIEARP